MERFARRGVHVLGFGLLLLFSPSARADIPPSFEEYPPLESMQEALCAKEKAGDICGREPSGAPLVCADVQCGEARCLRCLQTATPGDTLPPVPTVVRLRDPAPTRIEDDPAVVRATWFFRGSLAFLVLAVAGLVAAVVLRRKRPRLVPFAAVALGLGLVLAPICRYSLESAAAEYQVREEERAKAREVTLLPMNAEEIRSGMVQNPLYVEKIRSRLELYANVMKQRGRKVDAPSKPAD